MSGTKSDAGSLWNQIEQFVSNKLNFMNPNGSTVGQFLQQPEWVQNIVREALSKALPGGLQRADGRISAVAPRPGISTEVFETHREVIAKIKLPSKGNQHALQVQVRSDRIKLLGLPDGKPAFIPLPAPVVARSARARCREGVLEVYARKRKKGAYVDTYVEY